MGILNITPDSFSDGGQFLDPDLALNHAQHLHAQKADWIDVGAESTRPGSIAIDALEEIRRLDPVIAQLKAQSNLRISLDSCNAQSFGHYFGGNLSVWNDVCALTQAGSMAYAAQTRPSVVLMHRKPHLMQGSADNYKNVLLDVYDFLAERVASCDKNGITDSAIDPGIGFGKTSANNLILIKYINLFHSVGRPILLGVSRKKVVCQLSSEEIDPLSRLPGCVAIEAYAWSKGIRFFRVHDVRASRQALTCYQMLETA
jgi:dihydropteroate synthase